MKPRRRYKAFFNTILKIAIHTEYTNSQLKICCQHPLSKLNLTKLHKFSETSIIVTWALTGSTKPNPWLEIYCQLRLSPLCETLLFPPPPTIYLCFCLHNIIHMGTVACVVNYILPDAKTYCLVVDAFWIYVGSRRFMFVLFRTISTCGLCVSRAHSAIINVGEHTVEVDTEVTVA